MKEGLRSVNPPPKIDCLGGGGGGGGLLFTSFLCNPYINFPYLILG